MHDFSLEKDKAAEFSEWQLPVYIGVASPQYTSFVSKYWVVVLDLSLFVYIYSLPFIWQIQVLFNHLKNVHNTNCNSC